MRKEAYYQLFGLFHLLIGLTAALWGVLTGNWVLLPPSALVLFLGVLYIRSRKVRIKQRGGALFPSHGIKPQTEVQVEKASVKEYTKY